MDCSNVAIFKSLTSVTLFLLRKSCFQGGAQMSFENKLSVAQEKVKYKKSEKRLVLISEAEKIYKTALQKVTTNNFTKSEKVHNGKRA